VNDSIWLEESKSTVVVRSQNVPSAIKVVCVWGCFCLSVGKHAKVDRHNWWVNGALLQILANETKDWTDRKLHESVCR